jgi:hypothetical protein
MEQQPEIHVDNGQPGTGRLWSDFAPAWRGLQLNLMPWLEDGVGPMTDGVRRVVEILEVVRVEEHIARRPQWMAGRPPKDRCAIARGFVAKSVLNLPTTRALLDRLEADRQLRVVCGFDGASVPSESTFSRSFGEFAAAELAANVHAALIDRTMGDRLVGHIARDATEIEARQRPDREAMQRKAEAKKAKSKGRRGRPKKGEERPKEPTRLQRQEGMSVDEMLADLPTACDVGTKRNSKGHQESWVGYKLHLDVADGQIPISGVLTSASVHDSQVALPLAAMSAERVTNLYDLMDAAYDSEEIRSYSRALGHVPITDINPRGKKALKEESRRERKRLARLGFTIPESERYNARSSVERVYGRLKDEFGGRHVRVQGPTKVINHLMLGVLALTADQLLRLVT